MEYQLSFTTDPMRVYVEQKTDYSDFEKNKNIKSFEWSITVQEMGGRHTHQTTKETNGKTKGFPKRGRLKKQTEKQKDFENVAG